MGAFVDTSKVEVADGDNKMYIRRRMDFGTKCRVEDTLTQMALKNGEVDNIRFTLGAQKLALAIHNIIAWSGPDFVGVTCTPENIERLDPDYPLLVKAQERITALNLTRSDTDPNGSTATGAMSTTANVALPAADTIST